MKVIGLSPLDRITIKLYGMTTREAQITQVCIRCHEHVDFPSLHDLDKREYALTALCPACWERITNIREQG